MNVAQLVRSRLGKHRRLVRRDDDVEIPAKIGAARLSGALQLFNRGVAARSVAREQLGAPALELEVGRLHEVGESMPDDLEILRVELLLLDEHLFSHADFSEVVQQPGIAKLAQLLARESNVAIGAVASAVDRLGESDAQRSDARRVA